MPASLLCARARLGHSVVEAVLDDFDLNGPDAVQALREADPAAFGRVLTDLLAVRGLLRAEMGERPKDRTRRSGRTRRTRLAHRLLAVLEQNVAVHGGEWISRLHTTKPQAWAKLVGEAGQFRLLPKVAKGPPKREPRPVRTTALIAQMQAPLTVNLDDPRLPPDRAEALARVVATVGADALAAMSLEGLLEHFDDAMALWYYRWLGSGHDGRTPGGRAGTRSGSHTTARPWPLGDIFRP